MYIMYIMIVRPLPNQLLILLFVHSFASMQTNKVEGDFHYFSANKIINFSSLRIPVSEMLQWRHMQEWQRCMEMPVQKRIWRKELRNKWDLILFNSQHIEIVCNQLSTNKCGLDPKYLILSKNLLRKKYRISKISNFVKKSLQEKIQKNRWNLFLIKWVNVRSIGIFC